MFHWVWFSTDVLFDAWDLTIYHVLELVYFMPQYNSPHISRYHHHFKLFVMSSFDLIHQSLCNGGLIVLAFLRKIDLDVIICIQWYNQIPTSVPIMVGHSPWFYNETTPDSYYPDYFIEVTFLGAYKVR